MGIKFLKKHANHPVLRRQRNLPSPILRRQQNLPQSLPKRQGNLLKKPRPCLLCRNKTLDLRFLLPKIRRLRS